MVISQNILLVPNIRTKIVDLIHLRSTIKIGLWQVFMFHKNETETTEFNLKKHKYFS